MKRALRRELVKARDHVHCSHGYGCESFVPEALSIGSHDIPSDLCGYLAAVAPAYLEHRFDLLGSGWVRVAHGVDCRGLDGHRYPRGSRVRADIDGRWLDGRINNSNLLEARRLWSMIERVDYVPIDWQLDFKSGYRWSELTYFSDIRIGPARGADIKVPRELARMQHLPQLALCALRATAGDERFVPADIYVDEIRAEILDFVATNPPRFGVNWACAMDVAIRLANWLLTFDILAAGNMTFDEPLRAALARSVTDHANFIAANLEWSERYRTNHYLADIVGLLYAAARLERSQRTDAWLAFAIRELLGEVAVQFQPDGTCYEGSTSYHRLSAELVLFGLAITVGLPGAKQAALEAYNPRAIRVRPPFAGPPVELFPDATGLKTPVSPPVVERLWRAGRFAAAVTRPDGRICQIGDTDSGRLFWLHPRATDGAPPGRDDLDHGALIEAIGGLFADAPRDVSSRWMDTVVVQALAGPWRPALPTATIEAPDHGNPDAVERIVCGLAPQQKRLRRFPLIDNGEPWRREAFVDFGVFLFRRRGDFVAFRCAGKLEPETPSGHTHDDALGLEIMLANEVVVLDPGTYVYTAVPEARNFYRSAEAHDVPRGLGWSVAPPGRSLFALGHRAGAECVCWAPDAVAGKVVTPEGVLIRLLRFRSDALEVWDGVSDGILAPLGKKVVFCEGYGKKT